VGGKPGTEGGVKGRACDQCLGTDTQYECERGQCYAEHYQMQQAEWFAEQQRAEDEYWRRRAEDEGVL
jgi:hypothetical protein